MKGCIKRRCTTHLFIWWLHSSSQKQTTITDVEAPSVSVQFVSISLSSCYISVVVLNFFVTSSFQHEIFSFTPEAVPHSLLAALSHPACPPSSSPSSSPSHPAGGWHRAKTSSFLPTQILSLSCDFHFGAAVHLTAS